MKKSTIDLENIIDVIDIHNHGKTNVAGGMGLDFQEMAQYSNGLMTYIEKNAPENWDKVDVWKLGCKYALEHAKNEVVMFYTIAYVVEFWLHKQEMVENPMMNLMRLMRGLGNKDD